jgi:hypothetical protein
MIRHHKLQMKDQKLMSTLIVKKRGFLKLASTVPQFDNLTTGKLSTGPLVRKSRAQSEAIAHENDKAGMVMQFVPLQTKKQSRHLRVLSKK